jgi:hypothetical protein
MRLIDADELNSIMQNVEQYFRQVGFSDDSTPLNLCKMIVEAVLNKSPTVDAEPVVHARWVDECDGYRNCSECGCEHPIRDARGFLVDDDYCPVCGAKMDGGTP